jgi:hypothetical protein
MEDKLKKAKKILDLEDDADLTLLESIEELKEDLCESSGKMTNEIKEAIYDAANNIVIPEQKETDLSDVINKLNSLESELKKKSTFSLSPALKKELKGEKGDTTVIEKVIEKTTETVREIPIVTENVVERTTEEISGDKIVDRINTQDKQIKKEKVEGLESLERLVKQQTTATKEHIWQGTSEVRVKELIAQNVTPPTPETDPLSIHLNGDNSPTANIDWGGNEINNIDFVGDQPTVINPVTNVVLTRTEVSGSDEALYDNDGDLTFKAYSYKTIGATKYYSVAVTSNTLTLPYVEYIFNLSFTGTTGVDGYYLTYEFTDNMGDNMGGDTDPTSYAYGWDIGTNTTFLLNASSIRTRTSNPTFTQYTVIPPSLDLENDTLNISKLGKQTTNGFVTTTNSDGTISIDTNTYLTPTTADLAYYKIDQTIPQTIDGQIQAEIDNTDYTNISGAGAGLYLKNPNVNGQNVIYSEVNGAMVAKWRTDYVGNISWIAGTTGAHDFYVGGDYGTGTNPLKIFNNGNICIGENNPSDNGENFQSYGGAYMDGVLINEHSPNNNVNSFENLGAGGFYDNNGNLRAQFTNYNTDYAGDFKGKMVFEDKNGAYTTSTMFEDSAFSFYSNGYWGGKLAGSGGGVNGYDNNNNNVFLADNVNAITAQGRTVITPISITYTSSNGLGEQLVVSDSDRALGGVQQNTKALFLGSASFVDRLAHFDNNQGGTRTEVTYSNSESGWQNNFVSFMVHGSSFNNNYYFTDFTGKSYDNGWAYLVAQGSGAGIQQGFGILLTDNVPMLFGTNNLTRGYISGAGNWILGNGATADNGNKVQIETTGSADNVLDMRTSDSSTGAQVRMSLTRAGDAGSGLERGSVIFAYSDSANGGVSGWADYEDRRLGFFTGSGSGSTERVSISNTGVFKTNYGRIGKITTATDTYTILETDHTIVCNKATAFTVTLPTAVVGQIFKIKNINTGLVTIEGAGSDTIDGDLNQAIYQWECMQLQCSVANTWIIL